MRTIAIGDIHGCLRALETLLEAVQLQPDDRVVTIGDYVDRGPDSCNVIEFLLSFQQIMGERLVCLLGNHEILMQRARLSTLQRNTWFSHGGLETINSYSAAKHKALEVRLLGDQATAGFSLDRSSLTVGRDEGCDIVLPSPQVSAVHAEFRRGNRGEYTLVDLGSKNGTTVNGKPVENAQAIAVGDVIEFGQSVKAEVGRKQVTEAADGEDEVESPLDLVPDSHWDFMESCLPYFEIDSHFFVHANALADVELEKMPESSLFWDRFDLPTPHISGKHMICGHTGQVSGLPISNGHATCIDTLAYNQGGWLTALDVGSGSYWQANQEGFTRLGVLDAI